MAGSDFFTFGHDHPIDLGGSNMRAATSFAVMICLLWPSVALAHDPDFYLVILFLGAASLVNIGFLFYFVGSRRFASRKILMATVCCLALAVSWTSALFYAGPFNESVPWMTALGGPLTVVLLWLAMERAKRRKAP